MFFLQKIYLKREKCVILQHGEQYNPSYHKATTMKATETFRTAPWRHNCAQAIANRWQHLYADKDIVARYAPYIGGKAPHGYCGALYAAIQACPEHADAIRNDFASATGNIHCIDIKQNGRTPCETCVATADRLVEKYSTCGTRMTEQTFN